MPLDYVGFQIEDVFVFGYGLDYDDQYRNLPEIVTLKPEVARTPFAKVMSGIRSAYKKPVVRETIGPVLLRVTGLDDRVMDDKYSREEKSRAREMTFEEMAEEALQAKYH